MEILECFLVVFLGGLTLTLLVQAQDQSGFISLDCGSPKDSNYVEKTTNISYISDANFIDTGISKRILPEFQTRFQQQTWYLRSFPEGIRNCYRLNLRKGDQYLISAAFLYGNYDELDEAPKFDLHIGPNLWGSVAIENADSDLSLEILHVLPSNYLQVCLINTGSGTPFISALELRLLKNTTYRTQSGSLENLERLDLGSTTNRSFRFPEDVYDRFWIPYNFDEWTQLSTSRNISTNNDYEPPLLAMRTAATPINTSHSMNLSLEANNSNTLFYVFMHFAELESLNASESREFNISYNGKHWYGPFSPDYLKTTTIYSPAALGELNGTYEFSIYRTESSTLPPLLNAIEIYTVQELLQSETDQNDVDAIMNIKSMYGVKRNWQGDPCAPQAYLWDGLNCSYNYYDPPRITSLNLSSSGLTMEIAPYISNLTHLKYLDLSNNNLSGTVPDFLSEMTSLGFINLSGNRLTGFVPAELLERSKNGSLTLSVGGNRDLCAAVSCKKKKKVVVPVVASVASFSIVMTALATFWILKRRKQARKVDAKSSRTIQSFISKNRCFTYSEVLKITNNFERVLGKGGFGTVYHGYLDDTQVAVKMLSPSSVQGYKQFQAEVELLLRVHHRNLTSLVGYCDEGTNMGLIYEYMAMGNLEEHLSESCTNVLSWEGRLRIAMESAQGLEYLHNGCKPPIIHRDVKSTNILLNENFQAKLADFGLSRTFSVEGDTHVSTVVAGTPGHLDPEYYLSNRLTEKSDVYSFGVVLLEIITSRPVITKTHEKTHVSQWVSFMLAKGDVKNIVDPRLNGAFNINSVWKAVEVAMACVSPTSIKRPTMTQVVMELNECLAAEIARTRGISEETDSKDCIDLTMNLGTELTPLASETK